MSRIVLISIFSCVSMMSSVIGQCVFPDYDKFGLVCDEAHYLCGHEMDGFTGRLLIDKSPQPQPFPLCALSGGGQADNIQWFSFVTDDVNLEIVIRYSNCINNALSPGLQVGIIDECIYDDADEGAHEIFCVEDINYVDIVLSPADSLIEVGQLYYLYIDGYAGSTCDFEIDVISGICTDAPDSSQECEQDCGVVSLYPSNEGCTFFQDTFLFTPSSQIVADVFGCNPGANNTRLDSIICVEWDIQPATGYNLISSSFEYYDSLGVTPTLIVEWTSPGTYTINPIITFNPLFSTCQGMCECTADVVYTIDISESTIVDLPDVELCPEECIDFCGETYCETADLVCRNREECLIERISIIESPNIMIDQGMIYLCPGECFELQGVSYCNSDTYMVSDTATCDTTYLFVLEDLVFSVDLIQNDDVINCDFSEANLEGAWNTNFSGTMHSAWISNLGDTLTHDDEYTATEGGVFTYVVWPEGRKECALTIVHSVTKDDKIPDAILTAPMLNCDNPLDDIILDSQDDIMSTTWTGPNGYTSSDRSPEVNEAGMYEVTILATNGCELKLTTEVFGDFEEPDLSVDFDTITCSEDIQIAEYTTSATLGSHFWTLPDGSTSLDDILNLNSGGNYALEITATNGCKNSSSFNVLDLSYDPSLQLNEDRIWRCTDTEIILDPSDQASQGLNYIWTNEEGSILSNSIGLTITSPGVYILTTEDAVVECIGTDTVRIIEDPNPFVDVELDIVPPVCEGGNDAIVEILAMVGGEGPYTIEIDGEEYTDLEEIDFEAGIYKMIVTDAFGCFVAKDIEVPATRAFIVDTEPELTIRFGQKKTLTFETDLDENEISLIEWSNDADEILSTDREFELTGDYIEFINLRVENIDGCEVIAKIAINLSFEVDIYFPNVFSPNNDGNNDLFVLYSDGFPKMADDLKIYDRAGELIYKSTQTPFNETHTGWNGTFNGDPCQPGVYVFILEYTLLNGLKETKTGSITLVR